jgi:hypothetical protein
LGEANITKNLIINADDLGLTPGVSDGIIHGFDHGIVTSTSALMNTDHIHQDLLRTRQACPHLGIGVHMVITEGRPLLPIDKVPSLVDESGRFFELHHNPERIPTLNLDEVRAEWKTQIESFISCGLRPDHLDSHHHISYFNSDIFRVMLDLAREYQLPIRYPPPEFIEDLGEKNIVHWLDEYGVKAPAACITSFYGENNAVSQENILNVFNMLEDGTYEVMCHPGYADQELVENCSYSTPRELELEILTSRGIKKAVCVLEIQLIPFSDL